jgi:glutathione S-transferase
LQKSLEPARRALQRYPWLGGLEPRYADYILFGTFMWLRTITGQVALADLDPVLDWFKRCLALHGGLAGNAKTARAATPSPA